MEIQKTSKSNKYILVWLYIVTFFVLSMVLIGGVTRLTNSGLSIVEWKPITGALPPIGESEWQIEFDKYKTSPEFKIKNSHLDIEGFKQIFWLEYIHRLFGRILGMVFFIPGIFFLAQNRFSIETKKTLMIISILGISQGFMGWYMVKSGLVDSPYVSHFRLTIHLLFALAIFLILVNHIIFLHFGKRKLSIFAKLSLLVLIIQISLGGLVAGMDAGLIYNSFPKMGDNYIPEELYNVELSNYLSDPAIIQFFHRIGAYIVSIILVFWSIFLVKKEKYYQAIIILISLVIQFSLGVATLLNLVPVSLASMHQIMAFIMSAVILICGSFYRKR